MTILALSEFKEGNDFGHATFHQECISERNGGICLSSEGGTSLQFLRGTNVRATGQRCVSIYNSKDYLDGMF